MKPFTSLYRSALCAVLYLTFPFLAFSQGVQWTTSVNVGGSGGAPWADWILDVITTSEGNYLAVGFAREDEINHQHPDVPAYCLISPNGVLLRDGVIETDPVNPTAGRLANVVEASNDSYYAVGFLGGFQGAQRLLVRIDKTSLDAIYYQPTITHSDPLKVVTKSRLSEISNVPGANPYLLCSGWVEGNLYDGNGNLIGPFPRERWLLTINYDGTIRHQLFLAQGGEEMNACSYEALPNGSIRIFGASYDLVQSDGGFGSHRRHDSDIVISKIEYDPNSGFQTETTASYNSITQGVRDEIANAQTSSSDIFEQFPPVFPGGGYDQYPYGPKYLFTSFERDFPNCNESGPADGYYIEDWSDGSEDVPYSMVVTADKIVVSALLNRIIMWSGTNNVLGGNPEPGLHCDAGPCSNFDSDYYLWGEAYLLFFDKTDLSLTKATYLSSMSGGDFIPKVIKTSDGGFAVSGTVTGCPDGLPQVDGAEHIMVIKLDGNGDVKWRKHYNGQGEGSCGFAITETPDGGLLVAGNTEDDGQEHEENFGFIKFGSDCDYDGATVLPNSGNDYIVAVDEPIWNASRAVKARIVIPAGRTLKIFGTSTVIRFADSKEVFDFNARYPIGIQVERGGQLIVVGATLTGFDCSGTEKMWDGINIVGDENLDQSGSNQGLCSLFVARIVNARQGVVTSGVWCAPFTITSPPYAGTGSQSVVQTSGLHHGGPFGGGRVRAIFSKFIDNKRSAIFMKYPHNWNQSYFSSCDFISNGPLVDPSETLQPIPNNFNSNEKRGTSTHVSIWSTRVQFSNCDFLGSLSIIPEYRPLGIEGDDPKIVATGGSMNNLKIGIECRGPLGGILANVNANGISFDNVTQGIKLNNSVADMITGCHFLNIPPPNTYSGLSPVGIFGKFNKGALIRNNEFYGVNSSKPSWGIVEHNTQNQGCEIKENKFFSSRVGNQFEGANTQLTASCNDYTDMGFSAWYGAGTFGSGVLNNQGSPLPFSKKADNEFFDFCDGLSNLHIEVDDVFSPFGYYDKMGNPHPVDPDCVNDIVNVNFDLQDGSPPACAVPTEPCPNPPCEYWDIYLSSPKTTADRNLALRGLIHAGFAADTTDLPADYEGALAVLRDRNRPEDRTILIGSLTSMGRYSEAQMENNFLTATDDESVAYKAYMQNILDSGTDLSTLPESNYQVAMIALNAENVSTRAMAEILRRMREGVEYPFIAVEPVSSGARPSSTQSTIASEVVNSIGIWPNPFTNSIAFDLNTLDSDTRYRITVSDILGKQLANMESTGGQVLYWNTTNLPDGQYIYQVKTEKAVVQSGKLLKTDQ